MKRTTFAALCILTLRSHGSSLTWTGEGGDKLWSNEKNWNAGVAPVDGDALIFPAVVAPAVSENDLTDLSVESLTILAPDWTLGGNAIRIAAGIVISFPGSGAVQIDLPIEVRRAQTWCLAAGNVVNCSREVVLDDALTLQPVTSGFVRLDGVVSGSGSLNKTGSGTLFLNGANTFGGSCTVQEGTVTLGNAGALGSSAAGTVLNANTLLRTGGNVVISESFVLDAGSAIENQAGEPVLSGTITLNGAATFRAFTGRIIASGVISGGGSLTSIGQTRLTGSAANSWTGGTTVVAGTMRLGKAPGVNAVPGDVSVSVNGRLELLADHQIADTALVSLTGTGRLVLPVAAAETIGGLTMQAGVVDNSGALTVEGDVTVQPDPVTSIAGGSIRVSNSTAPASGRAWTVNGGAVLSVTGILSGDLLRRQGTGELRCSGVGSTVPLRLDSGVVVWNGDSPASSILLQGGTLKGTGRTGSVSISQNVSSTRLEPGSGPGIFHTGDLAGNLALTVALELNGTVQGTDYDSLDVAGSASFGLPKIALSVGYPAVTGDSFTILNKTSPGPVNGQFLATTVPLGEGAFLAAPGGHYFRITYTGGDGNDVVLTKVTPPAAAFTGFSATPGTGQLEGRMLIRFTATAGSGLTYFLQGSSDLINWNLLTSFPADSTGRITADFTQPVQGRLFYRLALP